MNSNDPCSFRAKSNRSRSAATSLGGIGISCLATIASPAPAMVGEAANAKQWSIRMADAEIGRISGKYASWGYVNGTMLDAFDELHKATGTQKYHDVVENSIGAVLSSSGIIQGYDRSLHNLDDINEGRAVILLHEKTKSTNQRTAIETLIGHIREQPRTTDGGFWHKGSYPYQMWLDGLYMGSVFYADYAASFSKPEYFDDIFKQIALMDKHLRDPGTGLFFHGWEDQNRPGTDKPLYWADPVTGRSRSFWGRGMGWYLLGIGDILDVFPKSHPDRDSIVHIYQRLCAAVVKYQDPSTGVWYQVVDKGSTAGNYLEASASCMFVAALAKGMNKGYLEHAVYSEPVERGYNGLIEQFVTGTTRPSLNNICRSAGLGTLTGMTRDGSFEYYTEGPDAGQIVSNDGKGVGPFIRAGIEVDKIKTSAVGARPNAGGGDMSGITCRISRGPAKILLAVRSTGSTTARCSLYSLSGTLLTARELRLVRGENSFVLEEALSSGTYIARFESPDHRRHDELVRLE